MSPAPSAISERNMTESWTACRATLFIAGGSAVLWGLIVFAVTRLI
ncbi:MAG: hypothetical protein O3B08_04535 [Proteobacteria bacterium]|nr:hypothetical protein [Pseudomonadota bacterium]